jgi:hypothetical protein
MAEIMSSKEEICRALSSICEKSDVLIKLPLCSLTDLAGAHRTFWLLLDTSPPSPPAHHRQNYAFLEGLSLIDIDSLPISLSAGLNVKGVQSP